MNNYKKLLDLIHQFKSLNIWETIDSRDIFQVELSHKNVYVSLLGNAGIEYGMMVYESVEDLSYQMMAENDSIEVEQPDLPFHLSGLKIECRDGKIMSQYDTSGKIFEYGIHDDCLALKFSVGKPMRLVNDDECLLLIELLELFIKYYREIKDLDFESIEAIETYSIKDNNNLEVRIMSFPAAIPPHYDVNYELDEEMLEDVSTLNKQDEWAIGIFYSPAFVEEDENPYFPKVCLIYNMTQEQIIDVLVPYKDDYEYFPQMLLESFIKIGYLPEYLNIANYETLSYFASLLDSLQIDGEVRMISVFNDIYDSMSKELTEGLIEEEGFIC